MTAQVPEKIGRYEVRGEIGRGSMGVVYEAFDPELERTVVVRTIGIPMGLSPRDREWFEARFFAEARIAARLSHPRIVMIHDKGRTLDTGVLFMALEHLEGRTLAELLQEGPLAWRMALDVAAGVAEALHYAHEQGVIHRDIKPANIMVLPDGEAKIVDFGIARIEAARVKLTTSSQFSGTSLYMSPEQALGKPVDNRIDLFALGAILHEMLTGRPAFGADTPGKIVGKVVLDDPAPPSSLVAGVPSDIDYVVARALAKDREYRYRDGRSMAEDVTDILAGRPPLRRRDWVAPRPGAPSEVTEQQVAMLRKGAFLPPPVPDLELTPAEDDPSLNLRRSVGGTLVSTPRRRTLPSSPRTVPEPSSHPEPAAEPPPLPAAPVETPAIVEDPVVAPAPAHASPPVPVPLPARAGVTDPAPLPTSEPLETTPRPNPGTRKATAVALGLALVVGIAIGAIAVAFLRPTGPRATVPPIPAPLDSATPSSAAPPEASPSTAPAAEETATPQDAAAAPEPTASPMGEVAAVPQPTASPIPAPSKEPRRRAVQAVKEPRPVATPSPPPAKLAIDFEHPLDEGTLRVWVDGELVLDETLDSQKTKKILVFKGRKGSLAQVLDVLPGDHEIRVEVAWDDNVKTKQISGSFDPGSTRRLSAKVGGLLKKGLSLKWE